MRRHWYERHVPKFAIIIVRRAFEYIGGHHHRRAPPIARLFSYVAHAQLSYRNRGVARHRAAWAAFVGMNTIETSAIMMMRVARRSKSGAR